MAESKAEVLVGAAVLAAAAGFVFYAQQLTGFTTAAGMQEFTASFRSIEGVSVGTDVRLAGVKVGSVTDLDLNPDTFRADARFTVADRIALPDDSAVVVSSEGLLGGNFVEILPGGSLFNLEPGSEIEDTESAISIVSLLLKFVSGDQGGGE